MEVWVFERYRTDDGTSEILNVFENADVGMNSVKHENIIWTEHPHPTEPYWSSNSINGMVYYVQKFKVILDEVPNN